MESKNPAKLALGGKHTSSPLLINVTANQPLIKYCFQ
jgi:hypothetical protein